MKIYFISGLGSVGKSTLAQKMSLELGIPSFSADSVYRLVMSKFNLTREQVAPLATLDAWENNKDWGIYKTPEVLLEQCYNEMFSYLPPSELIIEGLGLFLNPREHALVEKIFADYDKRYILIEQSYERWLKWRSKRPINEVQMEFLEEGGYKYFQKILRDQMPKNTWIIKNRTDYSCSPFGGVDYQNPDFSNPKWEAFKFPKNMSGKTFLDIGCNTGWFCKLAEENGAFTTGIDISWQVLDKAQDRVKTGEFYLSKFENFKPRKFDYILCSSAFHYFKKRPEMIAKLAEMTNYLVLELPLLNSEEHNIRYQGGEDGEFCSVVSKGLMESWLKKYFKKVEKIGETSQFTGSIDNTRPVYRATK